MLATAFHRIWLVAILAVAAVATVAAVAVPAEAVAAAGLALGVLVIAAVGVVVAGLVGALAVVVAAMPLLAAAMRELVPLLVMLGAGVALRVLMLVRPVLRHARLRTSAARLILVQRQLALLLILAPLLTSVLPPDRLISVPLALHQISVWLLLPQTLVLLALPQILERPLISVLSVPLLQQRLQILVLLV